MKDLTATRLRFIINVAWENYLSKVSKKAVRLLATF